MVVALRVSKTGFYEGNPEKVLKGRVDYVLAALEYNKFLIDYEDVYIEINRKTK
jgi:predicted  nucleic acid-binding Zn-ribbon protein